MFVVFTVYKLVIRPVPLWATFAPGCNEDNSMVSDGMTAIWLEHRSNYEPTKDARSLTRQILYRTSTQLRNGHEMSTASRAIIYHLVSLTKTLLLVYFHVLNIVMAYIYVPIHKQCLIQNQWISGWIYRTVYANLQYKTRDFIRFIP